MTSDDLTGKWKPKAMPCPFCGDTDGSGNPLYTSVGTTANDSVNYHTGFPIQYASPKSSGGKYVTRKEMNGVFNSTSTDTFYHRCGGLNTFDTEFCNAIGGYPKGAVLDYYTGTSMLRMVSRVDNNTWNFITQGVDSTYWYAINESSVALNEPKVLANVSLTGMSNTSSHYEAMIYAGETLSASMSPSCSVKFTLASGTTQVTSGTITVSVYVYENGSWVSKGNIFDYGPTSATLPITIPPYSKYMVKFYAANIATSTMETTLSGTYF